MSVERLKRGGSAASLSTGVPCRVFRNGSRCDVLFSCDCPIVLCYMKEHEELRVMFQWECVNVEGIVVSD